MAAKVGQTRTRRKVKFKSTVKASEQREAVLKMNGFFFSTQPLNLSAGASIQIGQSRKADWLNAKCFFPTADFQSPECALGSQAAVLLECDERRFLPHPE